MQIANTEEMMRFGQELGARLKGGAVIELVGDVGVGKTTLAKGIAKGLGVAEEVQSPSFTIARSYAARDGLTLNHYDFYRLDDPGIMQAEIADSLARSDNITLVEWASSVHSVLPRSRQIIKISYLPSGEMREVEIT
jgi:tRNA threonylcarbamoyladenosine biosynthesis protein TsaE